jgi:hypothetical protein
MYFFRQKFGKKNVYNDVKKNFKASAELLTEVTKAYVCEAFMEWAGFDAVEGNPTKITIPHPKATNAIKKNFMDSVIGHFVDKFVLPELDSEKALLKKTSRRESDTAVTGIKRQLS